MRGPTPRWYFAPGHSWTSLDALIAWVEITDKVLTPMGAGSSRGRSSELDDMRAGTGSFVLDNSDRDFDPTYTAGPYWQTYLNLTGASGSYASTPDHAGLDITGDLDVRARINCTDWTPAASFAVLAKYGGAPQNSWVLGVTTGGNLQFITSVDGTANTTIDNSTAATGIADGTTAWVRATIDVNDGAGNHVTRFYTSTDATDDHTLVTWTQLGTTLTVAGATTIFNSTSAVEIGSVFAGTVSLMSGKVYAAVVLSGIAGTVAADPVFSIGAGAGATSVTDSTGKVWTVNSPATIESVGTYLKPGVPVKVTGTANGTEYPVLRGFIGGWPQDYDLSNNLATVNVGCTDGMAKLATAGTPSSVYAIEVAADAPKAWWRLSETSGTSMADSGNGLYDGVYTDGTARLSARHPNPYETIPGLDLDGEHVGIVTDTGIHVLALPVVMEAVVQVPALDAAMVQPFVLRLGTGATTNLVSMFLTQSSGKMRLGDRVEIGSAEILLGTSASPIIEDGLPHHLLAIRTATDHGLYVDGVSIPTSLSTTPGGVTIWATTIGGDPERGLLYSFVGAIADVALYDTELTAGRITAHADALLAPWDGDTTGARIDRILGFRWPSDLIDTADGYTTLGPATLGKNQLQLIKGYEKAEQGRFFISRAGKATFLDRYYNQLVTAGVTSQATFSDDGSDNAYCSIAFDYDDRVVYNRVRASRAGGGEIEVYDQTSIDTYGEQVDSSLTGLDIDSDASVRGLAELRLDRYKNPQLRVRPIELKLHGLTAAQQADILDLELGYRVTVERTPQAVGSAITQETIVEGISHRIAGGQWTTTLTLSPVDTREYGLWGDNWGEALWGY